MNVKELQALVGTTPDGAFGPASRAALVAHFTNLQAKAVTPADITIYAAKLGCTTKQLNAVAAVESAGGGFDKQGRPKILFERHIFHRLTDGKWSPAPFSQSAGGGYSESSWDKLGAACAKDPDAAFSSASWGRFQVMGMHWSKLGYASPYELAHSTVESEAAHFDLLARFILTFGLADELRALSRDPAGCVAFARAYNGSGYRQNKYDTKLAAAMS